MSAPSRRGQFRIGAGTDAQAEFVLNICHTLTRVHAQQGENPSGDGYGRYRTHSGVTPGSVQRSLLPLASIEKVWIR